MGDYVDMEEFKRKQKKDERKQRFKSHLRDFECWVNNNPWLAAIAIPAAIAVGTETVKGTIGITKKLIDNNTARHQMRVDKSRIYDPAAGFYWYTRKELSSAQKLQVEQRHKQGESIGQILQSMGMLR